MKARLNEELEVKGNSLTTFEIDEIVSTLERTGINRNEVIALKAEITQSTNKNQALARVLETPSALCEQLKSIVNKIKR